MTVDTFVAEFGSQLLTKDGLKPTTEVLSGKKTVCIYFSAHWCPPCRGFTPKLADAYKQYMKDEDVEIVFVSSDQDEASFKNYYSEMPWTAVDFADRETKQKLGEKYGVRGIPALIVLKADGSKIETDGRSDVMQNPAGCAKKWQS